MSEKLHPAAAALLLCLGLCAAAAAGPPPEVRAELLTREIAEAPGKQSLYLRRAIAWFESGQPEASARDLERARSLGDPLEVVYVEGILLYRQQRLDEARPRFDQYLRAHPDNPDALDYRARLLRDLDEPGPALADYERLIALQPEQDPGVYLDAAQLMAGLPERGAPQALALLDARMATLGPIPQLQHFAIELERRRGNYNAAVDRLKTLDKATRATPEWHVEVAELLLAAGDAPQAREHLQVASARLQALRRTPARAALAQRVGKLLAQAQQ